MATQTKKTSSPTSRRKPKTRDLRIVVLQRGWVAVGDYAVQKDEVVLANASIVRRWGTIRGLGELARRGPLPNTILDPCGTLRSHHLAVVLTLDCEVAAWPQ